MVPIHGRKVNAIKPLIFAPTRMRLVIVTPIFPPATGGAATYYRLLCDALIQRQMVEHITVVTEAFPQQPASQNLNDGRLHILRIFPHRAGGTTSKARQYWLYALQNLQYLTLPRIVDTAAADVVLIHSSFHNQLNLLHMILPSLKRRARLIADIRDHQMPRANFGQMKSYSRIVACSHSVMSHLATDPTLASNAKYIPIPQEPLTPPSAEACSIMDERTALTNKAFILFAGLIKQDKGIDLLLDAYEILRTQMSDAPDLVLVGIGKDKALVARANQMSGVRHLGPMNRQDLLTLLYRASLVVNLSSSEGMPRICLEAMALNRPVILPRHIPEFEQQAPDSVAASDDNPDVIAAQMRDTLVLEKKALYRIDQHHIDNVVGEYESLLQ